MAALQSADDPRTAAAGSPDAPVSDASVSDIPAEPATSSRTRGKDARAGTTPEEQPAAPPAEEPEPDPDAMVVALLLPGGETWCTADGTPYRASGGQLVYVRQRHVAELTARGATEPERAADPESVVS